MLKRKNYLVTLLTLVMIFTVVACQPTQTGGSSTETNENTTASNDGDEAEAEDTDEAAGDEVAANGEVTEIRFSWWGSEERNERYNAICDLFEEANPDVKVLREPATWDDFWIRLSTQSAGGNAPTLFGMNPFYFADYAPRGVLANLDPFIENGTIDVSNVDEAVIDGGRFEDNVVMISQGVTTQAFLVNKTLLDEAGIDYPAHGEDWTWEEFETASKAYADHAKAEGRDAWLTNSMADQLLNYRSFAREMGQDVYEDGRIVIDTERLVQWWEFWEDLRDYGAAPPPAEQLEDGQNPLEQRMLAVGKIAMLYYPVNQIELWENASGGEFDIVRSPRDVNATHRSEIIEGSYFTVAAAATEAEQEAAAKLINFFLNDSGAADIFLLEQGVPANSEMGEHIKDSISDTQQKIVTFVNDAKIIAGPYITQPLGATEIEALYTSYADQVVHKMMTPQDAAEQFVIEAQAILDRED